MLWIDWIVFVLLVVFEVVVVDVSWLLWID